MAGSIRKKQVANYVNEMRHELVGLSRKIHSNPEICFKEFKSAETLTSFLAANNFVVENGTAGIPTAFKATAKSFQKGPVVAFMAEYDALPTIGHGCGHNLSGMASVGAAVAASKALGKLNGGVIVLGTPAEESGGGKVRMLEKGAFQGVDLAMMVHACYYTKISHDFIAIAQYQFHYEGKSAHASVAPQEGLNALDAAVLSYNAIGLLRQHIRGDCRIHAQINQAPMPINMIPEKASCDVAIRSPSIEELAIMDEKIKRCARGGAAAAGCKLSIKRPNPAYQPLKHNQVLETLFLNNLNSLGIQEDSPAEILKASTDAGNVSQAIPTIHPMIAICGPQVLPHTKEFADAARSARGENMFLECAKAMAMTAIEILESPTILKRIRACA